MIISLALKATAIVLIGLASARLARRSRASVRHAILVATFTAMAALPIAMIALPRVIVDVPVVGAASPIARAEALAFSTAPPARVAPEGQAFRPGVALGLAVGLPIQRRAVFCRPPRLKPWLSCRRTGSLLQLLSGSRAQRHSSSHSSPACGACGACAVRRCPRSTCSARSLHSPRRPASGATSISWCTKN